MREENRRRTVEREKENKKKKSVRTDSSYKQVRHLLTVGLCHKTNTLLVYAGS